MAAKKETRDWNELEFVSWAEFRQMAPAILQLEISRIGKIIERLPADTPVRNALVKARFELKKFCECLAGSPKGALPENCTTHLQAAILNLGLEPAGLDGKLIKTRDYVLDRLKYVHDRIPLIY